MTGDDDLPAVVVSHPKSGRTWLRFLLTHALDDTEIVTLRDAAIAVPDADRPPWPLGVAVTHDPAWLDRAPAAVALLRDPGEILVSFWFHATQHRATDRFEGSFAAFLDSELGMPALVDFLGGVVRAVAAPAIVTYDDLLSDPASTLARVVEICGRVADPARIAAAVDAGRFDVLQAVEAAQPINERFDAARPDRNRVRAGRADRGRSLLSDEERARLRDRIRDGVGPELGRIRGALPDDWAL